MRSLATLLSTLLLFTAAAPAFARNARPNVLLIILEDWGPRLGCYGEDFMHTPNLDRLAAGGRRYNNCFTSAPVCSTGRSSLMTGMSQYSTRTEQHRTPAPKPKLPPGVKSLPEIFRDAGYFTALGCGYSSKTDLNFDFPTREIYLGKDWSERAPDQPFFAHLTLTYTHRGWRGDPKHPIDPARVLLPPWYPDTPLTRKDWAMGLESVQLSDDKMGGILARLQREGLYENTAIVITADHGVALPRGKQFLYDDGLRIPLIVRAPGRAAPGSVSDELVSNVDILPTLLGIAGLPVPANVQGHDLLAPSAKPRQFIFAGRDRMDSTHDAMRAVRGQEFKFIENLMPERAYCQFNAYKERSYPGLALLNVLHLEGKLPPEQDAFMQPTKPAEELYDLRKDPGEVHNLAADPAHADTVKSLRAQLDRWRKSVGDQGVTEEFRKGGWPSTYPTRPLAEWQEILAQWEDYVLRGGPRPKIASPPWAGKGAATAPKDKKKKEKKEKKASAAP